jgi:hypothetical protein
MPHTAAQTAFIGFLSCQRYIFPLAATLSKIAVIAAIFGFLPYIKIPPASKASGNNNKNLNLSQ